MVKSIGTDEKQALYNCLAWPQTFYNTLIFMVNMDTV